MHTCVIKAVALIQGLSPVSSTSLIPCLPVRSLGGARAINRRYISDHVPLNMRTSSSAAFVSASALGMATGPAMAGLLNMIDFKVS